MALDDDKKKLWERVLDKDQILKREKEEIPQDPKSKIDQVYEQLEIDKQYEEVRKDKGESREEKPLC